MKRILSLLCLAVLCATACAQTQILAVRFYKTNSVENPHNIPDGWPAQAQPVTDFTDAQLKGFADDKEWRLMTSEEYKWYRNAKLKEYEAWSESFQNPERTQAVTNTVARYFQGQIKALFPASGKTASELVNEDNAELAAIAQIDPADQTEEDKARRTEILARRKSVTALKKQLATALQEILDAARTNKTAIATNLFDAKTGLKLAQ